MKKQIISFVMLLMAIFALVACGSNEQAQEENEVKQIKIGATQIVEHPSLDAAFEGFKAALHDNGFVEGENVSYDFQSAQGDQNNVATISNQFVADRVDLIFTNSTPSTLGALNATDEIPIVFASVSNPVGAGIVEAMDQPGKNITGVIDLHPEFTNRTIEFIDTNFEGAKVGYIYNSGEANSVSQLEAIKESLEGSSLSLVERTVATSAEVQQAADSLVGNVDVFLMTTDNTVVQGLGSLVGTANDYGIPLIVGDPESLEAGGFVTYGVDFFSIGYRAGEMAALILKGEKVPSEMNVEIPPELTLLINKSAAEAQGVEWNAEWDEIAKIIE
ncbi:BMP family ABC transporter substrate-binding protein [Anaerobacillus alkalilacustris]|uniref:BMP family ABC transporter substrate-binding protein n=1 Tax=Anaerobacillus alkalilacustris TaxID=393763 RepID=A0A1S2LDE0_9BACI|nr:ABC transporter substrate-binding protein [Anaerobacillus alkalilacustris]OIJ10509.1 BMP family ABC transporter substrate-binding protein [Anaerobacillus alkalilacustris]